MLVCIVLGVALTASAASSVTESDWIQSPDNALVKCEGGDCDHTECDYVYSFAVVGDTQSLNFRDAVEGSENMSLLYSWIKDNKEKYSIEYVMGVGDITESFNENYVLNRPDSFEYPEGPYSTFAQEWENAKNAIALLDGAVDYSLVIGNHDNAEKFNSIFGEGSRYYNDLAELAEVKDSDGRAMAGFFDTSKIEDTYRKLVLGGHKYIIFTLRRYPAQNADVTKWISDTLEANSDYSAIITLHQFMYKDSTILDAVDKDENASMSYERMLWEDCLSKHENVSMIISGHVEVDDIFSTQLRGDNGNTVTCMLIDGQEIDMVVEPAGMVAMLYISADGKIMNVEYISSIRDTHNKAEGTQKPIYLRENNQFGVTLDYTTSSGDGWKRTPYGYIPEDIYNNKEYSFHVILDDDANPETSSFHFGSYATWEETLKAVHSMNGKLSLPVREAKTYYVILSQDYTDTHNATHQNEAGKNPGKLVLDLSGYEFNIAEGVILPFYNNSTGISPEYTIKGGTVNISGGARIAVTQTTSSGNGGTVTLNLTDLNVVYGAEASESVVAKFNGSGSGAYVNLNITDCNIDYSAVTKSISFFNFKDQNNINHVTATVKGGSFKGNTSAGTTLFNLNENGDSVIILKDENGNYPTLTLNDNGTVTGVFRSETEETYLSYGEGTEQGGVYVYELDEVSLEKTPYGYVNASAYPAASNPFAFFSGNEKDGYTFIGAGDIDGIKSANSTTGYKKYGGAVAYLRVDGHTLLSEINPTYINGEFIIDLGGKTLIRGEKYLLNTAAKQGTSTFVSSVTVKNGTLQSSKNYFVAISNTDMTTSHKSINMTFDELTFKYTSTSANKNGAFFNCWEGTADDNRYGVNANLIYNDCVFDFTNTPSGAVMLKFKGNDKTCETDVIATFNGGTIITKNANAGWRLFESDVNEAQNSVKDENGNYTDTANAVYINNGSDGRPMKLIVTSDSVGNQPKSDHCYETSLGSYYFSAASNDTEGDAVAYTYYLTSIRPFEVFTSDGESKGEFGLWSEAFAKALSVGKGATVRLYSDAKVLDPGAGSGLNCTINVDLNGYTLSKIAGQYIVNTYFANVAEQEAKVVFSNGTIIKTSTSNKYGLFNVNYSNATTENADGLKPNCALATLNYEFNNVNFINEKSDDFIFSLFENGYSNEWTVGTLTNAVFNDCSFNYKSTVFALTHSRGNKSVFNVVVNGGRFVYTGMSAASSICSKDSLDSFVFGKNGTGKYATLTISESVSSSDITSKWIVTGGVECVFVKTSVTNGNVNYSLYPEVMAGYKIKSSITLYSNLVYNIYVAAKDFVSAVRIDGVLLEDTDYTRENVELDGADYIKISVPLAAKESLRDIAVKVSLVSGEKVINASWTVNITKYAKSILEGNGSAEEKALVKNILSYARAAYAYFTDAEDEAEKLAYINTVLGEGYDETNAPDMSAPAATPSTECGFKSVTVNLAGTPSYRFYLADGFDADDFTFAVGGTRVEAKQGANEKGAYLEVDMFAYRLLDDVTYTVEIDGVSYTESYNLYAYYNYVKAQKPTDTALHTIVERLAAYAESAKAFKLLSAN